METIVLISPDEKKIEATIISILVEDSKEQSEMELIATYLGLDEQVA